MTMKRSVPGAMALILMSVFPAPAQTPAPAPLDQKAADSFAGYYQVGPRGAMRFYREDTHFYFNTVGTTQKAETVPLAPNKFAYQNGAVVITFAPAADGKVNSVTVSIGGRDVVMPRITEEAANALAAAAKVPPPPVARDWALKIAPARMLITPDANNLYYLASFTPDGRSVLVSRTPDGGKNWTLMRLPAAGGREEILFQREGLPATRANIARDGRIVFNGGNGIWVMDQDGRNARAVPVKDMRAPGYPSWYPDGKSIAFGDGAKNILYRADVESGAVTPLTHQAEVLAGMSRVSPDGRWIVFAGQKNNGQLYDQGDNQIWVVDDKGVARPVEATPGQGRAPSWSPDGQRIAFESGRGSSDGNYAIFIINRDGTSLTQVTDYALNGMHPHWSPDGKQLVFSTGNQPGQPGGVAMVDVPD
jgi:dipeptidyl aminopeptidase/acylaminoacyl peptidase